MSNIVVLLAGGIGQRLGKEIPKQFVEVLGKPLIVYALEQYEKSALIDAIEIVCVEEYIDYCWKLVKKHNISKVKWIVEGGCSCQESTRKGVFALEGICSDDDIILLNMSTSLFVDDELIEDSIRVAKQYGNAVAAMQCIYNLAKTTDGKTSDFINFKECHKTLNLPWTAPFGKLRDLYHRGYENNIEMDEKSYMPTLFLAMGETLHFSKDNSKNMLHVVSPSDLEIIEACLFMRNAKGE